LDSTASTVSFTLDDVGELYRLLAARLERIVRFDVRAPDVVIEDACQFAWYRLILDRHGVRRDAALSWLATTAVREAWRLIRRRDRERSLEDLGDAFAEPAAPAPEVLVGRRQRLEAIGTLPVRQQRMLWLQGFGLSYGEIARHEGCTPRTVERQLLRAKGVARGFGD
jgi:RNA polymerase sigma factor (sigma-70 family)